jgi:adenine-specific DNA-methyltransferase
MMSDDNGVQKIDLDKVDWRGSREFFESLGEALDRLDDKDESFDFTWVGKRKSIIEAGAPINKTFRPDVKASKNWDTTENLFIEGDNLDALKLLQESYLGKVKMIYIDPPYNTGKDFVYHDNFKANAEQYDEDTEYKDEAGNIQFKKNEKTNGRYHSDWLSMMYPRLKLARNLLSEDGVIFISIDDNEQSNLKKLCDEVFGEDNFVNQFLWLHGKGKKDSWSRTTQQYVTCYAKQKEELSSWSVVNTQNYSFTNPDNDPRGGWFSGSVSFSEDRSNPNHKNYMEIKSPSGIVWKRQWLKSNEEMKQLLDDDKIFFGLPPKYDATPRVKIFPGDVSSQIPANLIKDAGTTKSASTELEKLMGGNYFDYPKSVQLIEFLAQISTADRPDGIVLDFFSGSATTAHAVMQLNAEDGGSRKWIMVQLPEETDEKSEAYKAGYKTIPEISRERICRAGDKIAQEHPEAKVDYGFRSLVIDDTNYKEVYKSAGQYAQAELLDVVDNIKEDRSDLDLLYGVLTQSALELNRPIEIVELSGSTTYKYDYFGEVSGLVACFAENISEATIKEIAKLKPLTAVFRESSFADSQAKVNLAEHFRILSPETKVKVV